MSEETKQKQFLHDAHKAWKNKDVLNEIKDKLTQLTILLRTQTDQDHTVGALRINKQREITENQEKRAGPIDIKGSLMKISIDNVKDHIMAVLEKSALGEEERELYKDAVEVYMYTIRDKYMHSYKGDKQKNYYHNLYKKGELSQEDMYIVFCLLNFLKYHKGTLTKKGEVTPEGLKLLHKTLMETKSMYERTGKGIGKVFHDGDYMSILRSNAHGHLKNYIDIIKYLLDKESFNPYSKKEDIEGQKRRARNKSNFLDLRYSFHRVDFSKKIEIEEFHDLSVNGMEYIVEAISNERKETLDVTSRLKNASSEAKKGHGRTPVIWDDSGLRILYYRDMSDMQHIKNDIQEIMKKYFDRLLFLVKDKKYVITEIELANKEVVSPCDHQEIVEYLAKVLENKKIAVKARRSSRQDEFLPIQDLEEKIGTLEGEKKSSVVQEVNTAYTLLTDSSFSRGSNGDYKDYKCIVHLQYKDGEEIKTFGQEIQFYNYKNDVGLANHNILDLEKDIFAYCKSNQDMSLDTLRRKTANTIKAMASQVNAILREKTHNLTEEARTFDVGNGKKISILGMESDTQENNQDMRTLTAYIINSFLHKRKLIHIYADPRHTHSGDIYPEDLLFERHTLKNRFTTSDVIKSAAFSKQIDANKHISMYNEGNYASVSVASLIDAIAAGYIPCKHKCVPEEENSGESQEQK